MTDAVERRRVVVWSGGADSTMLLTERGFGSPKSNPVIAITLVGYPQIPPKQLKSQEVAQRRYLAWARKQGFHIDHVRITVSTDHGRLGDGVKQAMVWVAHVAPFLPNSCQVSFGYIKDDSFWHMRAEADAAIAALKNLARANWVVDHPYEWSTKGDILHALTGWKVPDNCWWSCEDTKRVGVPCAQCKKCLEVARGREEEAKLAKEKKP